MSKNFIAGCHTALDAGSSPFRILDPCFRRDDTKKAYSRWSLPRILCGAGMTLIIICLSSTAFAQPLTLNQCLNIAFDGNPQIISAQEKVKAAQARLNQAHSALLPQAKVDAGFGQNYQQPESIAFYIPGVLPTTEFSTSPNETANVNTYTFSFTQPIFVSAAIQGSNLAYDSYLSAYEDYRGAQNDTLFNVTNAYYGVLKAQHMNELINQSMDSMRKHVRQVEIFSDAGMSTKADLLRAQAELANMEVNRIQAETGLKLSRAALSNMLGSGVTQEIEVKDDGAIKPDKDIDESKILSLAYQNRPDWNSFKMAENMADASVGLAKSGYLPSILFSAATGKTVTDYPMANTKYDLNSWRMMFVGSWNLFDSFATAAKVAEAQANLDAVKAQEKYIKDAVELDIYSAYQELLSAREKVSAAQIAQDVAGRALRMAEINYQTSVGTSLSYLDAQAAHYQAQSNYWSSLYDLEIAKAKINKVTGTEVI